MLANQMKMTGNIQFMKKLGLLLFTFILFACSSSDEECAPTLTIQNNGIDGGGAVADEKINRVTLVGYSFDVSIENGSSQTFVLKDGLIGGTDDILVTIHYGPMGAIWTKKKTVNFSECSDTKVIFP